MAMTTPTGDGLYMPAEWQPHARCWMAWPCRAETWGERIDAARQAHAGVAKIIAEFEPVTLVARPEHVADASLICGGGVEVMPLEIDDSWIRDCAPSFLVDGSGRVAGVHWRVTARGRPSAPHEHDAALGAALLEHLGMRRYETPMVLEGGAVHVDGEGTLLATEQCLLDSGRNPNLDRQQIEERLAHFLGVRKIIWLGAGLEGDPCGGHVDNVACFTAPGRVLALASDDPGDADYRSLQDNLERLEAARDAAGRALEVIPVPKPRRRADDGAPLALSYLNFYLANGAVVIPGFEEPGDDRALAIISKAYPERRAIPAPALDIAPGGGLHCITRQQPEGAPLEPPAAGA
jgi:agmatine deiminase